LDQLLAELAQEPNCGGAGQPLQAGRLWRPENVNRFYDEVLRLLRVNVQHAERIARATFQMAERLGEATSRAAGLRARHVYYRKRKYEVSCITTKSRWRFTGAWATRWRPAAAQ
jgi:hypothetical protein